MKLIYVALACLCVYAALAEDFQSENDMSNQVYSNVPAGIPVSDQKSIEQVEEISHKSDEQSEGQEDILSQDEISDALRDDNVIENEDAVHKQLVKSSTSKDTKGFWRRRRRRRWVDPCLNIKSDLKKCQTKTTDQSNTISRLGRQKSSLYSQISRLNSEKNRIQSQLSSCQSAKRTLQRNSNQYKNNFNRCESDKGTISYRYSTLQRKYNQLQSKCPQSG